MSRDQLRRALVAALTHPRGAGGMMEDAEIAIGARLILIGAETPIPLPREDWARCVVSMLGTEIRIIAIEANSPGNGAFRRLVENIKIRGFTPVVLEPIGEIMPAIMRRWGWKGQMVGEGFERHEEWRP